MPTSRPKLAAKIADDILYVKHLSGRPLSNPVNALEAKAWPMLSGKKAAKMTVTDSCVGCGQCARLCPRGNISIVNGRASIGTNCIGCLSCLQYCPKQAINMGGATVKRERYHNPNVSAADLCQKVIHID